MPTVSSERDVRVPDDFCLALAALIVAGPEVFLSDETPTYRSDATFYCAKQVALSAPGKTAILHANWHEGVQDFRDYSTWNITVVEGWVPDESWRRLPLELGPVSELRVVDERVVGAFPAGPALFTRAFLLSGRGRILAIAADVEEASRLDLAASEIAADEFLGLAHGVRSFVPLKAAVLNSGAVTHSG